jgi:hypothetical protein
MTRSTRSARRWSAVGLALGLGLLGACGGDKSDNTSPTPSITLTLSPTSASVQQGASTTVTATVTGANGFTGVPAIAITGVPTGVTGAPSNVQTSGSTTTITVTVNVAATTAAGTYPITVTATGSGVSSVNATFTLTVTAAPASSYAFTLSPTSLTVAQGGSQTATLNIARTNFTAPIALAVTGAPTGVTATFNPTPATANSSTLTVAAAANATTGNATLTITGTATGAANQTITLPITVTATSTGSYTLTASPTSLTTTQGGAAQTSTITINRTGGFAGSVDLAVTGAPAGVTATLNPASTTANSSTLSVTAAANATTGNATLTITGTSAGLANQTTTVALTVNASGGGTGNVTVDFSTCAAANKPIWLAIQNGTSGWTQVTGTADVYRFTINQSKGGIAYTTQSAAGATSVSVQYFTQAELTAGTLVFCQVGGTKSLTGTVAGLATGDVAAISLGGATATAATNGAFTLNGVANGNQDLLAFRYSFLGTGNERVILRRDQNLTGTIPAIDFGASEAFAPATATGTITGAGSDQVVSTMQYFTGACVFGSLGTTLVTGTTFTMRGIPAAQQRASDYHQVFVAAAAGTTAQRIAFESFRTLANRTIALGPALPTPTVTNLTAAYKRLQAVVTLPTEYQQSMTLTYTAANRSAIVTASFGWLGSATATLAFPDFAGVGGWQDAWVPATSTTVNWTVTGTGTNVTSAAGFCAEGAQLRSASVLGTL